MKLLKLPELNKNLQKYKLNFEFSKRITSNSIILIGDAAHSLHPIAGQG